MSIRESISAAVADAGRATGDFLASNASVNTAHAVSAVVGGAAAVASGAFVHNAVNAIAPAVAGHAAGEYAADLAAIPAAEAAAQGFTPEVQALLVENVADSVLFSGAVAAATAGIAVVGGLFVAGHAVSKRVSAWTEGRACPWKARKAAKARAERERERAAAEDLQAEAVSAA